MGIFAGSRPAARYCLCSATTKSPTTVEKITFGCFERNLLITEENSEGIVNLSERRAEEGRFF